MTNLEMVRKFSAEELVDFVEDVNGKRQALMDKFCDSICEKNGPCPVKTEDKCCRYSPTELLLAWLKAEAD